MTIRSIETCNDSGLWPAGKHPREMRSGGGGKNPWLFQDIGWRAVHVHNVPGSKLVKRFIKRSKGEAHSYRVTLQNMQQFVDIR